MGFLSRIELIKLYETTPEETLKKLGVYEKAKRFYDEKQEEERLREQRFKQAKELVMEAQELLDEYGFELRVTAQSIRFVNKDGRTGSARQSKRETGDRAPRGERTHQSLYRIPILQALVELGGEGRSRTILELVYEQMKDDLVPVDLEKLPSSGIARWNNAANWARNKMVDEGLLRDDSPHGIWEVSEKGRQYLQRQT